MAYARSSLRNSAAFTAVWVIVAASSSANAAVQPGQKSTNAQQADVGPAIIVTAQKREESALKVPIAITAFDAKTLDQKGVRSLEELSRSVPGLVIRSGGENAPAVFSVRGVGPEFNTAATVAVYLDDTPITIGINSPDLKIFDVARIEVLKGPQGTLFGSSAMGGAIRYISPSPFSPVVTGRGKIEGSTTAHGGQNYEAQGAIGAPVNGSLGIRASAFYRRDGGYIDVVDEATGAVVKKDANSEDSFGGRVAVGARLSPSITAILSALYQDSKFHDLNLFHSIREFGGVVTPLRPLQKTERVNLSSRDRFLMPNLLLNIDLGSNARLMSSTSFQRERNDLLNDGSYFIEGLFGAPPEFGDGIVDPVARVRHFNAFVQEVRANSTGLGPFQWLGGLYYRRSRLSGHQVFGSNLDQVFGFPSSLLFPGGAIEMFDDSSRVIERAAFGEASYRVVKALKLTIGGRYSELTRKVDQAETFAPLFGGNPPEVHEKSKEHPFTPKFSASYDVNDDVMIYTTAAKGFREGGPNPPLFMSDSCKAALAALGLTSAPQSFSSDSLWSYEVGAKGRTRDHTLTFQTSAYQIDWSNIQQSIALGEQCGNSPVANFGNARIRGAEAEINLHLIGGLTLDALANYYFEAELTEDRITGVDPVTGQPIIGARAGTPLAFVPKFSGVAAARYDWRVSGRTSAYVRAEIEHIGAANRYIVTTGANPSLHARAYNVVTARAALLFGNSIELAIFGDNLFDARPIIAEGGGFAPGGSLGVARTTIRPRTIGISLSKTF